MPTYVYECSKCDEEFEVWQSFSDDSLKKHPGCGGKLTKVYQPVGIVLKGPGFYKTDSRNGKKSTSTSERSDSSSDSGSKSESKTDTKSSDSKSSDSKSSDTKKTDTNKAEKAKPSSTSKPA
jgi:putative FmdB family regulatory protein